MWGRGCISALIIALTVPAASASESFSTPSGQTVTLPEVLLDENPGTLWVRFRFVAPQIAREGGGTDVDTAIEDMQYLCDQVAAPYLAQNEIAPERIVISLSDRLVPFGQQDAAATQFFELFSLKNGACMWEEF